MKPFAFLFRLFCVVVIAAAAAYPQNAGYHIIDSLTLGGDSGWDYLTVDTTAGRLYVSRGTRVQVVELAPLALVGEIPHTPGVHGIALVPKSGKGYTSNGRDSSVSVIDLASLKTISTIKIDARNPDAIIYDEYSGSVFTFNGGSGNATVIDQASGKVIATIPLGGKPEFAVSDGRGKVYVNIEDKNQLVAIDAKLRKVVSSWSIAPGEEPSGLALDTEQHLLFSVCGNRLMVVTDAQNGKQVTTLPIGEGVDGVVCDIARQKVLSSNGEGTMTVVRGDPGGSFVVAGTIPTRRGARTLALDARTHRVYTVTGRFGTASAPTPDHPHPRPPLLPGSVTLYVLAP